MFTIEQTARSHKRNIQGVLLLFIVCLVALPAWLIIVGLRRRASDPAALGSMSERWLLEYRASKSG